MSLKGFTRVRAGVPGTGRLTWLGPGSSGFLVPLDSPRALPDEGRGGRIRSAQEAESRFAASARREQLVAFRSFFDEGGQIARVVEVPKESGSGGEAWLGDDGGPGMRTGMAAFLDMEDVGTVVVPPVRKPVIDRFLEFGRAVPELLLLLEEHEEDRRSVARNASLRLSCPLANVAILRQPVPQGWSPARVAGVLEALDFRPSSSCRHSRSESFAGGRHGSAEAPPTSRAWRSLRAWRRRAGLRRSLDHGSRWVVFEPNCTFVWRALEREVRAFLHRLAMDGFFSGSAPRFKVRCGPCGEPGEGRVVLKVGVGTGEPGGVRL